MPIGVPSASQDGQWTFLELCQRTAQECGVSHGATLLPRTTLDQVGELRRIVDWVAEAWVRIQTKHKYWKFKRHEASFETVAGQAEYTTAECGIEPGTFRRWYLDTFRSYLTIVGTAAEIPMGILDYDAWRNTYKLGTLRTSTSQPLVVTQLPNNGLGLGPTPLTGYTVLGDYYTAPIRMEADDDLPELPIAHSGMLIVYAAMEEYGFYESAPEVLARCQPRYKELLQALEDDQLPDVLLAGPMA